MLQKRDFVTAVLVIYLLLLILFFAYRDPYKTNISENVCVYGKTCVRFCCYDHELCSNNFIKAHFNESLIPRSEPEAEDDLKILFGRPGCSTLTPFESNRLWQFSNYGIIVDDFYYDSDEYCLEGRNDTEKDSIEWDLMTCNEHVELHNTFRSYFMAAALVFITATLIVYILSKSLYTIAERCEFMFLIGMFLFHLTYPIYNNYFHVFSLTSTKLIMYTLFLGFLLTFLWISVLAFDIWWTVRYQKSSEDVSRRFKAYCFFVFGLIGLLTLTDLTSELGSSTDAYMRFLDLALWIFYATVIVADFILLSFTAFMVFKLSKSTRSSDHAWFEAEKERFLTYLVVFFVMLITWPFEFYLLHLSHSFKSKIIVDFLKLLSAIVIFLALACKKMLGLFKRYDTLDNLVL